MTKRDTPKILAERELRVLDEKKNVTGKISETCRYVGFGLLAIYYSFKVGDASLKEIEAQHFWFVVLVGALGFFVILFDYLQFFFAEKSVKAALNSQDFLYNPESCSYKARNMFFQLKQYTVMAGVAALALLFFII